MIAATNSSTPKQECPVCHRYFAPRGMPIHMASHKPEDRQAVKDWTPTYSHAIPVHSTLPGNEPRDGYRSGYRDGWADAVAAIRNYSPSAA